LYLDDGIVVVKGEDLARRVSAQVAMIWARLVLWLMRPSYSGHPLKD